VGVHLREQDERDGQMREAEMEVILQEKMQEWALESALIAFGLRP
jgi:hypothetical protein